MDRPPSSIRELVAESSLFSVLPPEAVDATIACLQPQWLDDGAYLFHAEQTADQLYLVAQGELEVVRPAQDGTIERLNTVGPGEVVGELAVLRGALRSASVRGRGRALLYAMHAADFLNLVHRWPTLAVEVARRVAAKFVRSEQRWHAHQRARVWCVHASLPADFVEALALATIHHLDEHGPQQVVVLGAATARTREIGGAQLDVRPLPPESAAHLASLADASEHAAVVLVHGDREALQWALPLADALVVSEEAASGWSTGTIRRLTVARTGLPGRSRVKARPGAPLWSAAPRAARILLSKSIGLALGGGGALGYAHLGVLETLEELGIEVDYVLGTSMGAVIGGMYLCRGTRGVRERVETMERPTDWVSLIDPGVVTSGVLSGRRALRFLFDLLGVDRFDELTTPFAAVALDIDAAEERVLREGSLPHAIRASIAIPGVLAPHSYDSPFGPQARFVDGGMINNVPVDAVRAMGADRVIGVHVMGRTLASERSSRPRARWSRRLPGLQGLARLHTAAQTYIVAMARSGERQVYMADVGILPDTSGLSMYELWRGREIAERGRQATLRVADRLAVLAPRDR